MYDYEFLSVDPEQDDTEAKSFLDFVEGEDLSSLKFIKKAKKALKHVKKQKKKIKKISYAHKSLKNDIAVMKADIKQLKKTAYHNKLADIVNSDNITERKHMLNDLRKLED